MIDRIAQLWPEIALFITACVTMVVGLSPRREVRATCPWICGIGLLAAAALAGRALADGGVSGSSLPGLSGYGKLLVCIVGVMILPLLSGVVDREYEHAVSRGAVFDAIRSTTAEFYSFYLFSLTGLLLCAGADDLIWLFLALELTSLPTYVMVAISTRRNQSLEAAVKYFFLGALGAAVFLYGFALLYGATGTTNLQGIQTALAAQARGGGLNAIALAGLVVTVLGLCFKIAAVPMHFYTPDVYQGAAAPISAMLAFVPKAAGFFSLMLVLATVGWTFGEAGHSLPDAVRLLLWVIAVLTMTVGNVLAILQTSVKRILAYSSIAHSGYMIVGLIAGPGETVAGDGLGAVLFYLTCYGVMNLGAFAVIGALERRTKDGGGDEVDTLSDLRGLHATHPLLAWTMVVCSMGLLGLPPLLGFFGKLPLFTAGISKGEVVLVVVLGINSAIAASYYLRLAAVPLLEKADEGAIGTPITPTPFRGRIAAGLISAFGVVVLVAGASTLLDSAHQSMAGAMPPTKARPRPLGTPPAIDAPKKPEGEPEKHAGMGG